MRKQNEMMIFNSDIFGALRTITINDEPYFIGRDIAEVLGYCNTRDALSKHVDDEDKAKVAIHDGSQNRDMIVINESGMYSLIFSSKKEEAKQFKRWVTSEVLPTLRKTGVVILEDAAEEAIDYQAKYGRYRIRKTFSESTDIRATYEEYARLSKLERDAKRIDNKDRIKDCKTILDVIETKLAENVTTMRGSEVLALRELALDIQSDITRLHNKANGGIKSAQTKKIQQLEEELATTQDDEDDFYEIPRHGFSNNYLFSYSSNSIVKSRAYKAWLNNLDLDKYLPQQYPNLNTAQPIIFTVYYVAKEAFDVDNMNKSIIDAVSEFYGFDDNIICEVRARRIGTCDNYNEGKMFIKLENI